MDAYTYFAKYYDLLMERTDYDLWTDYIEDIFRRRKSKPETVLELACGTGNIAIRLSERGYSCTGLDISESMLTLAGEKASAKGLSIPFVLQDMGNLDYKKKSDVVLCLCDGINYMTEKDDVIDLFGNVAGIIKPGGVFIFDISSEYKLSTILGNNLYAENKPEISYIWENYYDERKKLVDMVLTFFGKEGELYSKHEEFHIQRAYGVDELKEMLLREGFGKIEIYETLTFDGPVRESERITFVCEL
jgi:ubiquinone/menaquinone biosynthesis C-methylase UbiE